MNIFEEIYTIWTTGLINNNEEDLHNETVMSDPDIFMDNAVKWRVSKPSHWYIETQFDPISREVYQIEVTTLSNGIARYRWVNPLYLYLYYNNNFEHRIGVKHIKILYRECLPSDILAIARDAVEGVTYGEEEETETISLDMTDAELALIARAAHAQDVTINQFFNDAIKYELDKINPEWQEEVKKSV